MEDAHDYAVTVQWTSGKEGRASAASLPDLDLATPEDFGGPGGIWSPEHLLVASVASCVMTTFLAIAANSKLEFSSFKAPASSKVIRGEDRRYRFSTVEVAAHLTLKQEKDRERAERILRKVHDLCLISNSIRAEIRVESHIDVTG